jgi:choline dehydrogenase
MNGYRQEGFGPMDMTVRDGRRWSTANAYLRPALTRPGLRVISGALATRVLFEGRKATGLEYTRGGQTYRVAARREVILSGGPINSPQLLQLSGIGDGNRLQGLGISTVLHRPAVGENLQDHLELYIQQRCRQPITLFGALKPWRKLLIGIEWMLFKSGLGATNHFETGGFVRSRAGIRHPDIQFHFLPMAVSYDGRSLAKTHGFQAHVGPMRSRSRGWVRLDSPDPAAAPRILFNYLSHEEDRIEMRACVRLTREIFAQEAFAPYRGEEILPGADVQSDAEIDAFVRQHTESAFHPCGTCRMGSDAAAVIDPRMRVRDIDGLRVVDSSIMPSITSGNLNAPTIMLAEKAADIIRGRPPLAPSNAAAYIAPNWQTAQR